jgi:PAS domain S-box-containing protein
VDVTGLIAWLAEGHPAAILLTTAPEGSARPAILYANPAFEALTGHRREDVLGLSPRLLQGPHTDSRGARLLAAAARKRRSSRAVLINYRRDGSEYLCEIALHPVIGAGGEIGHMLGLAREVRRRRGRPAREGRRFLPVPVDLALAPFAWPGTGLVAPAQAP